MVQRVDYGDGWTREVLADGGYRLTSLGGPNADATIIRSATGEPPTVEVHDAPAGTTITVSGTTADIHQP